MICKYRHFYRRYNTPGNFFCPFRSLAYFSLKFGADTNVYGMDKQKEIEEIRRKAIGANLKLIECPIRHLGTEEGYKIYTLSLIHI